MYISTIRKDLAGSMEKVIQSSSFFKTKMKNKLLNLEIEVTLFNTFAFGDSLPEASTDGNDIF